MANMKRKVIMTDWVRRALQAEERLERRKNMHLLIGAICFIAGLLVGHFIG